MFVVADGVLAFQNTSIDVDQPDNDTDVQTIPGGQQGSAPGPDVTMISISNAIPKAGADYNWELAKRNRTEVNILCQQIGNTKKLKGKFRVKSYKKSTAVGQPTTESIEMSSLGSPAPIFE